jgi:hypothetical protein
MSPQKTLDEYVADDLQPLLDHAERLKEARIRPIPQRERYPAWWGQLWSWNQCPKTLGELDCGSHRPFNRDDREDSDYKQHFVEIHDHTDTDSDL